MRSRLPLLTLLLAGSVFIVPHFAHAAIPFYGPIIPSGWDTCPSNWAGLITVANNVISFLITIVITFVAPIMIAYAGFLYLTSGENPGQRSQANGMMQNVVIGIVIALASWLIVDAFLAVLYNPSAVGASWYSIVTANGSTCINVAGSLSQSGGATNSGTCSNGLTCQSGVCYPPPQTCGSSTCGNGTVCGSDGQTCVSPAGVSCGPLTCQPNFTCNTPTSTASQLSSPATDQGPPIQIVGQSGNGCPTGSQLSGSECYSCPSGDTLSGSLCIPPTSNSTGDGYSCVPPPTCSSAGGVTGINANGGQTLSYGAPGTACDSSTVQQQDPGISNQLANQLACIAQRESTCGTKLQNYAWDKDSGNGKASSAYGPYQVLLASHSSCYDNSICEQAGGTPGTPLNCKSAFTPNGYTIPGTTLNNCMTAASNIGCSAAAAACATGGTTQGFESAYATDPLVSTCAAVGG